MGNAKAFPISVYYKLLAARSAAALGHNGGVEAFLQVVGHLEDLVVAVDGDGFGGGVEDDFAVFAGGGVGAYLFEEFRADLPVEVVGKLA